MTRYHQDRGGFKSQGAPCREKPPLFHGVASGRSVFLKPSPVHKSCLGVSCQFLMTAPHSIRNTGSAAWPKVQMPRERPYEMVQQPYESRQGQAN